MQPSDGFQSRSIPTPSLSGIDTSIQASNALVMNQPKARRGDAPGFVFGPGGLD
jgi:hypothetical protein